MREVVLLGVGVHKFGRFPGKEYYEMGRDAVNDALKDAGVTWPDMQAFYCGHTYAGIGAGGNIVTQLGMTGIPIYNIEMGCAAGSGIFGLAYEAIATGQFDIACVVGVDKLAKGLLPAENFPHWMRVTGLGIYPVSMALQAHRRMKEYGLTREQLAKVAVKSHKNASLCPNAHYQQFGNMTIEDVYNAKMVCDPLTIVQIAPTSEGAAAAILCSKDALKRFKNRNQEPVTVASYAVGSGEYVHPYSVLRHAPMQNKGGVTVCKRAYEMAGCGPEDIGIAQVEDAYTIIEMECYEVIGICKEGEMGKLVDEGAVELTGRIPVGTDGGKMSRGNSIGACALASLAENYWQMKGQAGKRQIPKRPNLSMLFATGVPWMGTAVILKR